MAQKLLRALITLPAGFSSQVCCLLSWSFQPERRPAILPCLRAWAQPAVPFVSQAWLFLLQASRLGSFFCLLLNDYSWLPEPRCPLSPQSWGAFSKTAENFFPLFHIPLICDLPSHPVFFPVIFQLRLSTLISLAFLLSPKTIPAYSWVMLDFALCCFSHFQVSKSSLYLGLTNISSSINLTLIFSHFVSFL